MLTYRLQNAWKAVRDLGGFPYVVNKTLDGHDGQKRIKSFIGILSQISNKTKNTKSEQLQSISLFPQKNKKW